MFEGLLNAFKPDAAQDQKLAEQYGVSPEVLQQQRMASLGNIGAILLAAGEAGPIGQRGEILSKLGGVGAASQQGILNAQQARIAGMKMKEAEAEQARMKQVRAMVEALPLSPEQKAWALANPEQFLATRGQSSLQTEQAVSQQKALMPGQLELLKQQGAIQTQGEIERERATLPGRTESAIALERARTETPIKAKVAELVAAGVPEDRARGIVAGRYREDKIRDADGNESVVLTDLATSPVGQPPQRAPLSAAQETLVSPMPTTGEAGGRLDYSEATGGMGALKNGLNVAMGQFGSLPQADAAKARAALNNLYSQTVTRMTATVPGRASNQMRELLAPIALKPGNIFEPDPLALDKLTQTKSLIDSEVQRLTTLQGQGGGTKTQQQQIRSNLLELKQLSKNYGVVLDNFGEKSQTPPKADEKPKKLSYEIIGVR